MNKKPLLILKKLYDCPWFFSERVYENKIKLTADLLVCGKPYCR